MGFHFHHLIKLHPQLRIPEEGINWNQLVAEQHNLLPLIDILERIPNAKKTHAYKDDHQNQDLGDYKLYFLLHKRPHWVCDGIEEMELCFKE